MSLQRAQQSTSLATKGSESFFEYLYICIKRQQNIKPITKSYRKDINTLRAIAVLLVLFFHLDFRYFEGGFLGVDMFFVISGYLISKNILYDVQQGTFAFRDFYVRRIRRLFPALLFTLIVTICGAYFFLAEASMSRLGKVAVSAMVSVSNFFFLGEQGYFNADASLKPLLHTWSLGVEEQFYLIWPFLLLSLYKLKSKAMWLIVLVLIVLSIGGSFYYHAEHPNLVFFMLPFRMFEFLIGLLAFRFEKKEGRGVAARNALISIGVILIVFALLSLSPTTGQGQLFAHLSSLNIFRQVLCCIGTMFIVGYGFSESKSMKSYFFDKPIALIGKSSYSIYLIHWPLIVFYKMYKIEALLLFDKVKLIVLSISLGYLMCRFIENAFRYKEKEKGFFSFKYFVSIGILVLLFLVGFILKQDISSQELESVNSYQDDELVATKSEAKKLTEDNIESEMKRYWQEAEPNSPILKGTNGNDVIVMGNSHAVDLIYAFKRNGLEAEITSFPTTHLCYHFGSQSILPKDRKKCEQLKNRYIRNKKWKDADAVFLHDHWPVEEMENLQDFVLELRTKTKAPIYIFGPKMVFKSTIPQIVKASGTDDPQAINAFALRFSDLKKRSTFDRELNQVFDSKNMKKQNIHYISLLNETGIRQVINPQNKDYYYFDKSHLTEKGAIQLGKSIKKSYPELFKF